MQRRDGNLVGIDIDSASRKVQLDQLTVSKLPGTIEQLEGEPPNRADTTPQMPVVRLI